jgi:predicted nucleotide-binding protein
MLRGAQGRLRKYEGLMNAFETKLAELVQAGKAIRDQRDFRSWQRRVYQIIQGREPVKAQAFLVLEKRGSEWTTARDYQAGFLEGLILASSDEPDHTDPRQHLDRSSSHGRHSKRVFVVHGLDTELKESAARFVERLGLVPIVLHEQASKGLTVIEEVEAHADVGFAVVLLTPDDQGGPVGTPHQQLNGRARQDVILELGYFIGRLSRGRVCALFKQGVEIPSNYRGVLYIEFDAAGAWRTRLAQELVDAGFSITLEALLNG